MNVFPPVGLLTIAWTRARPSMMVHTGLSLAGGKLSYTIQSSSICAKARESPQHVLHLYAPQAILYLLADLSLQSRKKVSFKCKYPLDVHPLSFRSS